MKRILIIFLILIAFVGILLYGVIFKQMTAEKAHEAILSIRKIIFTLVAEKINFVEKLGIEGTEKIYIGQAWCHEEEMTDIVELEKEDVPRILDSLRNVSCLRKVYPKCMSSVFMDFYTGAKKVRQSFYCNDFTGIHWEDGSCDMSTDFTSIINKYKDKLLQTCKELEPINQEQGTEPNFYNMDAYTDTDLW